MKRKHTILKIFIICFVFIVSTSVSLAFWGGPILNSDDHNKTMTFSTGKWMVQGRALVYEDPVHQQKFNANSNEIFANEGDIVYRNGVPYVAITTIRYRDTYPDPANPPTSALVAIRYREKTYEYRSFHHYGSSGPGDAVHEPDYVIYNGQTFVSRRVHYANGIWGIAPTTAGNGQNDGCTRVSTTVQVKHWFRYQVYYYNDVVFFQNNWYSAKIVAGEQNFQKRPPDSNYWGIINQHNQTSSYAQGTIVRTKVGTMNYFYKAMQTVPANTQISNTTYWKMYYSVTD